MIHDGSDAAQIVSTDGIAASVDGRIGYLTDIEGDLDFWRRYVELSDVLSRDSEGAVALADQAHFVYGGDAVDQHAGDLEVLEELLALKQRYPERVHFIIGNRDANKLRLLVELGQAHVEAVPLGEHPGPYWSADGRPANRLSAEELGDTSLAVRLQWMLKHTMGAYDTFEHRRRELSRRQGGCDVSDDAVVESFLQLVRPGGLLFEYLALARFAVVVGGALFVHAGLPRGSEGWMPGWLPRWQGDAPARLPLAEWLTGLERLRATAMAEVAATAGVAPGPRAWSMDGGYIHAQAGSALMQYTMRDMPDGTCQPSVVYNGWLDEEYQPMLPDEATCEWLRAGNIRCVICGHQPHGDAPLVLRVAEGIDAITADTSYASAVEWEGEERPQSTNDVPGRGAAAVCEVVLEPAPAGIRVHGVLGNGAVFEAQLDDRAVGRVTADGWRVKGRLGDGRQLLLSRNKGWSFVNRLAEEEMCEWLEADPAPAKWIP